MKKNVGKLDQIIRGVVGIVLLVCGLMFAGGMQGETLGIILAAVGVILAGTAALGWCPPYALLGISTKKDS